MNKQLTDEEALLKLYECSKVDPKALKLMADFHASDEFGDQDMIWNQILNYVKNFKPCLN